MAKKTISGYILYRYVCEQCGIETEWIKKELRLENDGRMGIFSDMREGAGYSREKSDKLLLGMSSLLKRSVENGDYSDFDAGALCPACSARQSWLKPMPKSSVILSVVATMFACVLAGVLAGFIISLPGPSWTLAVAVAIGVIVGALLSALKVVIPYMKDKRAALEADNNKVKALPEICWDIYSQD